MRRRGLLMIACAVLLCIGCAKSDEKEAAKTPAGNQEEKQEKDSSREKEEGYSPILSKEETDTDNEYPYEVRVNRTQNCITVYGLNDKGEYTVPVRAMICSTGGNETPLGTFQLGGTSRWQMNSDGAFCQYATRIVDDVAFCTAPYFSLNNNNLDVEQFNRMGEDITGSSIQMETADAKWIAQNCPEGTKVEIYEEDKAGPLGKPRARVLQDDETKDPTDQEKNAKKKQDYVPVEFAGIEDMVVEQSAGCDLLGGVTAKDSDRKDLTAQIQVFGDVDVNTLGVYEITYLCMNDEQEARTVKRKVIVSVPGVSGTVEASAAGDIPALQSEPSSVPTAAPVPTTVPTAAPAPVVVQTSAPVQTAAPEPVRQAVLFPAPFSEPASIVMADPTPTPAGTVNNRDVQPPDVEIVAQTRYVQDLQYQTLRRRIRATDNSGRLQDVYITVEPLSDGFRYVVIYEAVDEAGNKCCASETVQVVR